MEGERSALSYLQRKQTKVSLYERDQNRLKDLNLKGAPEKCNLALINPYKILNPKLN